MIRPVATVLALAVMALTLAACGSGEVAAPAPTGPLTTSALRISVRKVADADQPVGVISRPGDAHVYVIERVGRIRAVAGAALDPVPVLDVPVLDVPVLDVSALTVAGGERGLLGAAFGPDGRSLFVHYTDLAGDTRVDRYALGADGRAQPASRTEVLAQKQPYSNHNGGELTFGPDGLLYLGLGDGGSAGDPDGNGQNLGTWLGKILRIDPAPIGSASGAAYTVPAYTVPAYTVPADNPFVGRSGARPEIWAYGLRNPWRFSFDSTTGDLWIGDVGQNRIEEIDRATTASGGGKGANFGWRRYEGTTTYDAATDAADPVMPVFQYGHDTGACSVTGGVVYRGQAIPALVGTYLFGDYCRPGLRGLDPALPATAIDLSTGPAQVVGFGVGPDGEVWVTSLAGGVYEIVPD